jgi:two-component system, OmpR family, response regulator
MAGLRHPYCRDYIFVILRKAGLFELHSDLTELPMKVLVVEDERKIAGFVCAGLKEQGFTVEHCAHGDDGFDRARDGNYDVIVLDIMLPGRDGLSILKALRKAGNSVPVILLTARNELDDRVEGLSLGADDYLAKPFFVEELIARIHALLRRVSGERQNILAVGDLKLDRITREVTWRSQKVDLTGREFNLIEYLMRSPGRVFTRTQILEHVWGYDFDPTTNVVDVCIQRIRKKIASIGVLADGESPVESLRGVGYRFRKLT